MKMDDEGEGTAIMVTHRHTSVKLRQLPEFRSSGDTPGCDTWASAGS